METHEVKVLPALPWPANEDQLAWKIAAVAADPAPLDEAAATMAINRIIGNGAVAIAAVNRDPVVTTRTQALAHPRADGAPLLGLDNDKRVACEWAAFANSAAVRELDWHDNAYGIDASHPCENIPAIIAVAQQSGRGGEDVLRGILTAYEIHLCLAKGIPFRPYRMDHQALLGPAIAAGIGTLLGLETETVFHAVNYAAHVCLTTRQGRKGIPSSWKAYCPGHFAKLAVESVDRAMRGEKGPAPIFEGDFSLIATVLGGPDQVYQVPLPAKGEPKRSILESFTKEYAVSSHGQSLIDIANKIRGQIEDLESIEKIVIHCRSDTHNITGNGAKDADMLYEPTANKRFLDHSAPYCLAVALEDGEWHHMRSYLPERAQNKSTVRLWQKISTVEDDAWNKRFDGLQGLEKDFGAGVVVTFKDGREIKDEIAVPDAHPRGTRPFDRDQYIGKFDTLTDGLVDRKERNRFLNLVERLPELGPEEVRELNVRVDPAQLTETGGSPGIF
ncbi:MAG: 2-methylcitrate dehydratase [Rhodospirillaceae bacterium]|nr:2-methylcitrate dehydratase [Rhodospirillaceae bacterium]